MVRLAAGSQVRGFGEDVKRKGCRVNLYVHLCMHVSVYVCVCVHMHEYVTSWEEKVHTVSIENLCLIDLAQYYIPSTRQVLGI